MSNLSILEFLRTGMLGEIRPGARRDDIERFLGTPDDESHDPQFDSAVFVRHGNLHLQYDDSRSTLDGIDFVLDDGELPTVGARQTLDSWIVQGGISSATLVEELARQGIAVSRIGKWVVSNRSQLTVERSTLLLFEGGAIPEDAGNGKLTCMISVSEMWLRAT